MRKLTRFLAMLLCAALIVTSTCATVALAAESKTVNYDLMLVVDDTGSMRRTDPHKLASVALERFVDLLPHEGCRIGMATYAEDIKTRMDPGMVKVESKADLNTLKEFAANGLQRNGAYTDIATALAYAVDQLYAQPESDSVRAIIAVSDGENDFETPADAVKSDENLKKVLDANIPVYLLVINASGTAGIEDYMNKIADGTGGKVYYVNSGDEIPGTLRQIQADIIGTQIDRENGFADTVGGEASEWKFTLGDGVFEANLELTHENDNLELHLLGGNGQEIPMTEANGVVRSVVAGINDVKTVVKLMEPEAGDYTLQIRSPEGAQYVLGEIVYNYEIYVEVSLSAASAKPGDEIDVTARLMRGTEPYTGLALSNLSAVIAVDGGNEQAMDAGADCFTCKLQAPDTSGSHDLVVTIRGKRDFNRSSDPLSITVSGGAASSPSSTASSASSSGGTSNSGGFPIWILAIVAAVIVAGVVAFIILKNKGKKGNSGGYIQLRGTLVVNYYKPGDIFMWEKYVQPGSYYSKRNPTAPLGKMMRDQQDFGEVPPCFDPIMVGGVQTATGEQYVEIRGNLGTEAEPNMQERRLKVDVGMSQSEFDSFDDDGNVRLDFADGSYAYLSFSLN